MLNPLQLTGKTILLTGASSGIGRETAILLSKLGTKVVLTARNVERLEHTLSLMEGNNHLVLPLDINNHSEVVQKIQEAVSKLGMLDGLVHCAGILQTMPLQFIDMPEITNLINTNLVAVISLIKAFRHKNIAKNPAFITIMGSVSALFGLAGLSVYSATKGALISLTKTMAVELAKYGIRVNAILPGFVDTEMTQGAAQSLMANEQKKKWEKAHLLGVGEAIDIANMVAFLAADTAKWITGSCLVVDGGFSVFKDV